jgi:ribosome-binding protein aMBF1 (putative translation factor)
MSEQDWTPVTINRRTKVNPATSKLPTVQVQASDAARQAAAIERRAEEGSLKPKHLNKESREKLIHARLEAQLTQVMADAQCNLPRNTIKGIENGSIVPNQDQLRKISRALHVDLKLE